MSLTISQLLLIGKNKLKCAGISSYSLDAVVILMYLTGYSKIDILINGDTLINESIACLYLENIEKRAKNMPVQYITKNCEFMSLNFYVDENVLIPRPDTEILVEYAIELIKKNSFSNVLDICTGSGCIAISIVHYALQFNKNINVTAIDISEKAVNIARNNAAHNKVLDYVNFIIQDIFLDCNIFNNTKFDMILSNPPYIKAKDIMLLDENVKDFEPKIALNGGEDGLCFYREIAKKASLCLNNGGVLIFEIGYNQAKDVYNILKQNNFSDIKAIKDLAGLDRVVSGCFRF